MTENEFKCFCFGCNTLQERPIGEEGVCDECARNQKWYEEGVLYVREKLQITKTDIKRVVQILPHAQGWVVNGQKIEK